MKRNALIAGAVGLVVVILAWYFIIYSPIGDDLSAAETSTASEQAKTQDLQNTLARLAAQQLAGGPDNARFAVETFSGPRIDSETVKRWPSRRSRTWPSSSSS